jgi:hypothetical protein
MTVALARRLRAARRRTLDNPASQCLPLAPSCHPGSIPANADFAMIDRVLAAIVLAVCAVMLVRLSIGERRRYRFDAALRRVWYGMRRSWYATGHWFGSIRRRRSARREAEQVAQDAIRRASRRADWDGNVNTPKSFRKPPRDKMH